MEYSRHLSDITRSTTMLMGNSRTRAFSDSEAAGYHSYTYHGQYDDFRKRNSTTLGSVEGATTQIKVYNLDKKFHRKFGRNEKVKETRYNSELAPTLQLVNREDSPKHLTHFRMDDDGRSFCDSVLSFACSDFPNADGDESTKDDASNKNANFDAIEKWLQYLPEPGQESGKRSDL